MFEKEAEEYVPNINWHAYSSKEIREEMMVCYRKGAEKANEWHKADVPTSPINKVVLGYIKHYNSKLFCLVGWNGKWWYDASTYNDEVKLIAWKEIIPPKEESK